MKTFQRLCIALLLIFSFAKFSAAQKSMSDVPVFGAQIFIEPGQTPEDIDTWFDC